MGDAFFHLKIYVAVVLLIITFISTFIPWVVKKQYGSKSSTALFMSFCNCLAGGTVLGVMLMHVVPSLIMTEDFLSKGSFYPIVAMFSAGISFLVLFAIDRLFTFQCPSHIHADSEPIIGENPIGILPLATKPTVPSGLSSKTSALAMILALSLHSFLEGLGLGPIHIRTELISYIVGLVSHKWLEAFALGVNIYNAGFSFSTTAFLNLFYSLLTPLGILIGMTLVNRSFAILSSALIICIINGLSIGSFLFVCCIEMIPPEFAVIDRYTHIKYGLICIGFLFMSGMALFDD